MGHVNVVLLQLENGFLVSEQRWKERKGKEKGLYSRSAVSFVLFVFFFLFVFISFLDFNIPP